MIIPRDRAATGEANIEIIEQAIFLRPDKSHREKDQIRFHFKRAATDTLAAQCSYAATGIAREFGGHHFVDAIAAFFVRG